MQEPEVINLANHYHKALDEIEEICLKAQDPCQDDWDRETENFAKQILDIICKAKGEEND